MTHTVWVPSLLTTPWTDLMFIKKFFSKIVRPLCFKTFYKLKKWWNKKTILLFFFSVKRGPWTPGQIIVADGPSAMDVRTKARISTGPEIPTAKWIVTDFCNQFIPTSGEIGFWSELLVREFFKNSSCDRPILIGRPWPSLDSLVLRRFASPHSLWATHSWVILH